MLLETPCIVADLAIIKKNILQTQELCNSYGCNLRPHIKTHKSVEIARMQIEAGAVGITCAKVSEAEVMADGGITDIFIAYPLIGESKLNRAMTLAKKLKRLILAVDSLIGAEALSQMAKKHGLKVEVRLEIDTGAKRTGVSVQNAVDLALAISKLSNLQLSGLYTFKGMMHQSKPTTDKNEAALEECTLLHQISCALSEKGVKLKDLSAGSTPTGLACAATGLVNEVRPGTYVFYDQMCVLQGVCKQEDVAAHIVATVVSTPTPGYAIIDGGSKTFPTDVALNQPPFNAHSYAYVLGKDHLRLDRLNEEHGILRSFDESPTGLQIGDTLQLSPNHICPAINLQNYIWLKDGDTYRKLPIDARGMLI